MTGAKTYHGLVTKGRFSHPQLEAHGMALGYHEGKAVTVTVDRVRARRSGQQNRYYHGVIIAMIAEDTGNDPATVHDAMRAMFLSTDGAAGMKIIRSTTSLNTAEMEQYHENIRRWASTALNIYIPDPGEDTAQ
jgi:hypothetical protein